MQKLSLFTRVFGGILLLTFSGPVEGLQPTAEETVIIEVIDNDTKQRVMNTECAVTFLRMGNEQLQTLFGKTDSEGFLKLTIPDKFILGEVSELGAHIYVQLYNLATVEEFTKTQEGIIATAMVTFAQQCYGDIRLVKIYCSISVLSKDVVKMQKFLFQNNFPSHF